MTRSSRFVRLLAPLVAIAAVAVLASGCTTKSAQTPVPAEKTAQAFPVTLTDDASRTVTIAAKPQRIVSLAPANTEILFAIGAGKRVVGVTTYDDYPAEVKDIAKIGDFAQPNFEAIAAAKPDLVLATTGVQADAIKKLEELGATVIAVDPTTLDAVYADIAKVGEATGDLEAADGLVSDMKASADEIARAVSAEPTVSTFVEIGQNPLFTVGSKTLLDELVRAAGGVNVVTQPGYVPYSVEQVVKANPQVYLATKSSGGDAATIAKRAGYSSMAAVKNGRVVILDDNVVSRPGPRIIEGLRLIAEGLHPEAFGK